MRLCDLQQKEVINTCDCRRIGHVADLVFDECTGCIQALVVPRCGFFACLFGGDGDMVIPYECIRKIGPDIILVEVHEEKLRRGGSSK